MGIRILDFKTEHRVGQGPIDWVHFASRDSLGESGEITHSTWEKVDRLRPPEMIENDDGGIKMKAMTWMWQQVEPAYQAWKAGNEIPETGTPLGAWPGVTHDQAEALRAVGIKTVEDMASTPETILANPPLPNMRELMRQAQEWIEGADKAEMQAKIAELSEQNAAMLEMLEERTSEPKKRGRPPKNRDEAA